MERNLWLAEPHWSRHQLSLVYGFNTLRFETAYWYESVDLLELEASHGRPFLRFLFFHLLLLEASKLISLRPDTLDPGPCDDLLTADLEAFWRRIVQGVWAQWRYQNDLPEYSGPQLSRRDAGDPGSLTSPRPARRRNAREEPLLFCGGGKDSLVAMKLLEHIEQPFASLAYSSSVYGRAQPQHQLIDGLLDHGEPQHRHRMWIQDSLLDLPAERLLGDLGVSGITAAETPCSAFAALPIALAHGHRYLVVGHERSANAGNLTWEVTGEDINHQWGKSRAAERLINRYIKAHLLPECHYFSLLQPIHDPVIFYLLRAVPEATLATHSCNQDKPWCGRCPKCAYVGLGYHAYLAPGIAAKTVGPGLLDREENQRWFHQMLGLGEHTPFECIGQVDEVRLAFELCVRRGVGGKAMELYQRAFPNLDPRPILQRQIRVARDDAGFPAGLAERILPRLDAAAGSARRFILDILQEHPPQAPPTC